MSTGVRQPTPAASSRRTSIPPVPGSNGGVDVQYFAAVGLTVTYGKGSTSFLQRTLGITYEVASRLIDRMEAEGVLAAPNHVGKREVLISKRSK